MPWIEENIMQKADKKLNKKWKKVEWRREIFIQKEFN